MMERVNKNDIPPSDMNSFFTYLKNYCGDLKKEDFVMSRTALEIDKKDIIIFEADFVLLFNKKGKDL